MNLSEVPTLQEINQLVVKTYTFMDNLDARFDPYDVYKNTNELDKIINLIKNKFIAAGWEGDGDIKLIWIPCFLDQTLDELYGEYVWHVKQDNNGISFLAINKSLDSERLKEQNKNFSISEYEIILKNIIYQIVEYSKKSLNNNKILLVELLTLNSSELITEKFYINNLELLQGNLISTLNYFIDEVYGEYLIHVIGNGNKDSLKLNKIKTTLDLEKLTSMDSFPLDESNFDILTTITSCVWKDFKFLDFKERFSAILKCVDYNCDKDILNIINKHVAIRNCFQHHQGKVEKRTINKLGFEKLEIKLSKNQKKIIKENEEIQLTKEEIELLVETLLKFYEDYNSHVNYRIKTREQYRSVKKREPIKTINISDILNKK